jgi:hypothetical protein
VRVFIPPWLGANLLILIISEHRRGGIVLGFSPRLERTIGFILVVKRFSHQINTDEVFGTHSRARRAQN